MKAQSWKGRALFKIFEAQVGLFFGFRIDHNFVVIASNVGVGVPFGGLNERLFQNSEHPLVDSDLISRQGNDFVLRSSGRENLDLFRKCFGR